MIQFRAAQYTADEWKRASEVLAYAYSGAQDMPCYDPLNCRSCHVCADIRRAAEFAAKKAGGKEVNHAD